MANIGYINLSFIGDCMLASYRGEYWWNTFNYVADEVEPEYFFAGVYDILNNDDFTIANCENVFTDNKLNETYKNYNPAYWYKSPSKNADIFKAGSVEVVSLANNHTYDYGEQGYYDTIAAVEKAGLIWGSDNKIAYVEKDGFCVSLLMVNVKGKGNVDNLESMIDEAKKNSDYIVVYFHGGTERVYTPPNYIVNMAHEMIDLGCDLIIGAHPHVLQPIEEYKGKKIVYSLGNFIFGAGRGENRTIIYQHTIYFWENEVISAEDNIIPCYCFSERWQPAVIYEEDIKQRVLDFLNKKLYNPL